MFDRRANSFSMVNAYLFNTTFSDGLATEIEVNPEFGSSAAALIEAQKYGTVIGRLPHVLRTDVQTVWIHKGTQPFGGGNHNLLIHTGQADLYAADGILEETFVHEASHTSLDAAHASASGWLAAQIADNEFISTYARDNPTREDIAESFLPYLAAQYRSDRISLSLANTILQTIPNRIDYFNHQAFDMHPLSVPEPSSFILAALGLIGLVVWRRRRRVVVSGEAATYRRPRSRSVVVALCAVGALSSPGTLNAGTIVSFDFTNVGSVQVELFNSEAPLTVANFRTRYATLGRYSDTMIHRVDTGLGVVQGGGFTTTAAAVATAADPMIPLEYSLPNARGTLAMARSSSPNSATSQWYFNTHDNSTLSGQSNNGGYAVFGQVLGNGMDVIDAIAAVPTFAYGSAFNQVPLQNFSIADFNNSVDPLPHVVVLNSVSIVPEPSSFVLAAFGLIGLVV